MIPNDEFKIEFLKEAFKESMCNPECALYGNPQRNV